MDFEITKKDRWVPDLDAVACQCDQITVFGPTTRRHHCRICGLVVCKKCTHRIGGAMGAPSHTICAACYETISTAELFARGVSLPALAAVERCAWYHGQTSRQAAEALLLQPQYGDGDYLVRRRNNSDMMGDFSLSVRRPQSVVHFLVEKHGQGFRVSASQCVRAPRLTIPSLVAYYHLNRRAGIYLRNPVLQFAGVLPALQPPGEPTCPHCRGDLKGWLAALMGSAGGHAAGDAEISEATGDCVFEDDDSWVDVSVESVGVVGGGDPHVPGPPHTVAVCGVSPVSFGNSSRLSDEPGRQNSRSSNFGGAAGDIIVTAVEEQPMPLSPEFATPSNSSASSVVSALRSPPAGTLFAIELYEKDLLGVVKASKLLETHGAVVNVVVVSSADPCLLPATSSGGKSERCCQRGCRGMQGHDDAYCSQCGSPLSNFEIPREQISLDNVIGVWRDGGAGSRPKAVAVKARNGDMPADDFLHEAMVMKHWQGACPNVLRLFGTCIASEPHLIVLEFVAQGSLESVLHARGNIAGRVLDRYAVHMARGMRFLHKNGIIHCDLATRNVLVDENHECKIADFGLALLHPNTAEFTHAVRVPLNRKCALRWAAPEIFWHQHVLFASDVWSFAITLLELYSGAQVPFAHIATSAVLHQQLRAGMRAPCPARCPKAIYDLMLQAWLFAASDRPTFVSLVISLEKARADQVADSK